MSLVENSPRYQLNISNWGKAGWAYLTAIVLRYPETPTAAEKMQYKTFLTTNGAVIPCGICRTHYQEHLKKFPLSGEVLASRRNLAQWMNDIHNEVNVATHKPKMEFLDMVSEYMPPSQARSMLVSEDEWRELVRIDSAKNIEYTDSSPKTVDCARGRKRLLFIILVATVLALFIGVVLKYLNKKTSISRRTYVLAQRLHPLRRGVRKL